MNNEIVNDTNKDDGRWLKTGWLQVLIHASAWVVFLALPAFFRPPARAGESELSIVGDLIYTPRLAHSILLIFIFYFNYYYAIPRLYLAKKYGWFAVSFLCCLSGLLLIAEIMKPAELRGKLSLFSILGPGHNLFMFMNVYALAFALRLYGQWRIGREEQLTTEVSFLKAQINPHFLFNSLNSIYSLAITKSDHAADAVEQLSSIMRYSVTEADKKQVALAKEITYIKDYIALRQLRLTDRVEVVCEVNGDERDRTIVPFILTPVIENAFKYGVSTEEDATISIRINIHNTGLNMEVTHDKIYVLGEENGVSGLGLADTEKRLKHFYPKKHNLVIDDADDYFKVSLTIQL